MLREGCVNQLSRPKCVVDIEGVGNCEKCTSNDTNKYCRNYVKIMIYEFDVNDEE
jgi:hypothetical protein